MSSPPPPPNQLPPPPRRKKGENRAPAREQFSLTSPYGPTSDTILYQIEVNHAKHEGLEAGHAALARMAHYLTIHQAVPHLRPREQFPRPSEEQVLYVRVMASPVAWSRLRHQAQRLGLVPRLIRDTNEVPPAPLPSSSSSSSSAIQQSGEEGERGQNTPPESARAALSAIFDHLIGSKKQHKEEGEGEGGAST